jgi:uncharacterized membrane protein
MPATMTDLLAQLRKRARERRHAPPKHEAPQDWGERAADWMTALVGSWRFIMVQSALLAAWIAFNAVSPGRIDPYPFILLNLLLSFQAAYTAPIIMMSQNRQAEIDRRRSIDDYEINRKAELEIETLHEKIDLLREQEIAQLTASVARLTLMLEARQSEAG